MLGAGRGTDFTAQTIVWGQFHQGGARKLIDEVQGGDQQSELGKAKTFLRETLEAAGPDGEPVNDLKRAAEAQSLKWRTIVRAKGELGAWIRAVKHAKTTPPRWHWVWQHTETVDAHRN